MRAILLDRDGLHEAEPDRIDTLLALPAALGLSAKPESAEADPGRGDPPPSAGHTPEGVGIRRRKCLVRSRDDVDVVATISLHREQHQPFVAQRRAAHLSCVS